MIDLIGHFGSRLSYATIAEQLATELSARHELGLILNLDDQFIDSSWDRFVHRQRSAKVLVLSDPTPRFVDGIIEVYGEKNVAVFACPNTDKLDEERRATCRRVGQVYTPSEWCADVIWRCEPDTRLCVKPLGVGDVFTARPFPPPRSTHDLWPRLLHVSTDGFWPGRKGTAELIAAMKIVRGLGAKARLTLTLHVLSPLFVAVHQELSDHGLLDDVVVQTTHGRGTPDAELRALFERHDMLVAPSRSEGFGVMPLSALVCGMPVITTAASGQREYLREMKGWLQVPTGPEEPLYGEDGLASTVHATQLAYAIASAVSLERDLTVKAKENWAKRESWSWATRRREWVDSLIEWTEGSA